MIKVYTILFFTIISSITSCHKTNSTNKIKGISVVGAPKPVNDTSFKALERINSNFACLIPYAFTPENKAQVITNYKYQWWGETPKGIKKCHKTADSMGLKTMIKPQLWIGHGAYTGHLNFATDEEWLSWEEQYLRYILKFAVLADSLKSEMFCIGTELGTSIEHRPKFWDKLIDSVKTVFTGKLTYAANWDDYKKVHFWSKLDYIGVDAYFPLCDNECSEHQITLAWKRISKDLERFSNKYGKPILFTEFGYPSAAYALNEPWKTEKEPSNYEIQNLGYQVFFEQVWPSSWLAGIFIWKWYPEPNQHRIAPNDFTPQGKPALKSIKEAFKP
jgi:hypothetical protein